MTEKLVWKSTPLMMMLKKVNVSPVMKDYIVGRKWCPCEVCGVISEKLSKDTRKEF